MSFNFYGFSDEQIAQLKDVQRAQLRVAIDFMRANGIRTIEVTFDGCGDSGQIEGIVTDPRGPDEEGGWRALVCALMRQAPDRSAKVYVALITRQILTDFEAHIQPPQR